MSLMLAITKTEDPYNPTTMHRMHFLFRLTGVNVVYDYISKAWYKTAVSPVVSKGDTAIWR